MRALVTGGSRGIGKAIVYEFEQAGYEVIAPTRDELDLRNKHSIENYINNHKTDCLDTIINNAGINDIVEIEHANDSTIEEMLAVNLIAPLFLLRGFIPAIKRSRSGRIVNIGSIWASVSKPGRGLYSTAKNGLHGLTNTLALELSDFGILVNTVCPGFTATELTAANNSRDDIVAIESQIPLGRLAKPEEIARFVRFLGSTENTYITGQKILIDGGFTVR